MTRLQAVGVMLIALGLIYALLYAAWLRKQRRHRSAAVAAAGEPAPAGAAGARDRLAAVTAEGTYVSTTTAASRLERVAVEGIGNRARATMTVRRGSADELVRYDRQGEQTVVIPAGRVIDVRRDRGMAGKFVGANRLLVVQWRANDAAIYETGFLPRHKADLERLETALWWHRGGGDVRADDRADQRRGEPTTDDPAAPRAGEAASTTPTTEGTTP